MSKRIRTGFAAFLLIVSVVALALIVREYRSDSDACQLLYTRSVKRHDIVEAARNALSALNDAEIQEQNYVLTGETVYSEAYKEDLRNWQDESGALELVAQKDPAAPIVKDFSQAGTRTLAELALVISIYEKSGREPALDRIRKSSGIVYLDQARKAVGQIRETDGGSADGSIQFINKVKSSLRRLAAGGVALFVLAILGMVLLFF